jgi:hypothetical protein
MTMNACAYLLIAIGLSRSVINEPGYVGCSYGTRWILKIEEKLGNSQEIWGCKEGVAVKYHGCKCSQGKYISMEARLYTSAHTGSEGMSYVINQETNASGTVDEVPDQGIALPPNPWSPKRRETLDTQFCALRAWCGAPRVGVPMLINLAMNSIIYQVLVVYN